MSDNFTTYWMCFLFGRISCFQIISFRNYFCFICLKLRFIFNLNSWINWGAFLINIILKKIKKNIFIFLILQIISFIFTNTFLFKQNIRNLHISINASFAINIFTVFVYFLTILVYFILLVAIFIVKLVHIKIFLSIY